MSESAVISAERVTRRYGSSNGFEAVRGVDLAIRRGELFALLGTNGAGKTSILELLEGLAAPTTGTIRVLAQDPFRARRIIRPRIGILLQDHGLAADLTVAETARTWAGTLTTPRPYAEVLDLVGLTDRHRVRVRQLSGGERQRLSLALAVMGRPEVLFLDEPTAGLDPESKQGTWRLVGTLLESGTTVLLTTHQLAEAEALADRIAILHRGRIVGLGTPSELAATRPAQITFNLPSGTALPLLPDTLATTTGNHVTLETDNLQPTLETLLTWASGRGLRLHDLTARPASLEEAFLAIASSAEGASPAPHQDAAA